MAAPPTSPPAPAPVHPFNEQPQLQAPAPAPALPYHPPPPFPSPNVYAPPVQQQDYTPQAAHEVQQPYAAPTMQVNETEAQGKTGEPFRSGYEKTRYGLYFLDFLWGVVMWSLAADSSAGDGACLSLGSNSESSGPCTAIISLGVIMMLVLFVIIGTHSLKHFRKPFLPYLWEAIAFTIMSLLWFILAAVAMAEADGAARKRRKVLSLISAGVCASISHGISAWVAYKDFRGEKVSGMKQVAA